jgi:Protein of unknown function (DUF3168)
VIETALYQVLQAQPAIAAITAGAVYPILLPIDSPLPALTYQIVGSSSAQTQATHGMQRIRLQVDCWATTYLGAVTLRDVVANSLDGYEDSNFSALLLSRTDFFEDAALQYRAMLEFYIFTTAV